MRPGRHACRVGQLRRPLGQLLASVFPPHRPISLTVAKCWDPTPAATSPSRGVRSPPGAGKGVSTLAQPGRPSSVLCSTSLNTVHLSICCHVSGCPADPALGPSTQRRSAVPHAADESPAPLWYEPLLQRRHAALGSSSLNQPLCLAPPRKWQLTRLGTEALARHSPGVRATPALRSMVLPVLMIRCGGWACLPLLPALCPSNGSRRYLEAQRALGPVWCGQGDSRCLLGALTLLSCYHDFMSPAQEVQKMPDIGPWGLACGLGVLPWLDRVR